MSRLLLTIFLLSSSLTMTGCPKQSETHSTSASRSEEPLSQLTSTGIAECDDLMQSIQRCFANVASAEEQATLLRDLQDSIDSWQGRSPEQLKEGCRATHASAKQAYAQFGCEL